MRMHRLDLHRLLPGSLRKAAEFLGVNLEFSSLDERIEQVFECRGLIASFGELGRERARLNIGWESAERREENRLDSPGIARALGSEIAEQRLKASRAGEFLGLLRFGFARHLYSLGRFGFGNRRMSPNGKSLIWRFSLHNQEPTIRDKRQFRVILHNFLVGHSQEFASGFSIPDDELGRCSDAVILVGRNARGSRGESPILRKRERLHFALKCLDYWTIRPSLDIHELPSLPSFGRWIIIR